MEIKNYFATDAAGNILPSATCYVYKAGTTDFATGVTNINGAALPNPFTAQPSGLVQFAAPDGDYDLRVTKAGRDFTIRIQCFDGVAFSSDLFNVPYDNSKGLALIPYKFNAAGATTRTAYQKMTDFVSVKDFGAKGDGVTDDYPAIQAALTWAGTWNVGKAAGVTIHFPFGEYRMSARATYDIPAGTPGTGAVGINLIGDGPAETLIVANATNTEGCIRLTSGRNIEAFAVRHMAFLSDLNEDAVANNGVALTVDSALKRGDPGYGDQARWSVILDDLWVAGYGKTHSDVARRGNFMKGIYVADKYHPKLSNIRVLGRYSGTLGTRTAWSHAVHIHACYSPDMTKFYVQGSFTYGVWLTDKYDVEGGFEDFRFTDSFIAASDYGFGILHENSIPGNEQLTEPGGIISNLHINARIHGITIWNHHQVLISNVYGYAPRENRRGTEPLPSIIYLHNASDILIDNCQFLEPGFYKNNGDAAVAIRIEDYSESIVINAQFGHGGIGVLNNSLATGRKTIVINAELTTSRRIIALWATLVLLVDNKGTATLYQNVLGNAQDVREFASAKPNAASFPMSMRVRSLTPANEYGGAIELSGTSVNGNLKHLAILRSRMLTKGEATEDSVFSLFIQKAGALSEAFRLQAPSADNDSYGYLMFQVAGSPVVKRVKMGAAGTGPGGVGRALFVDN